MKIFVEDSNKPIERITINLKSANTRFARIRQDINPYVDCVPNNEVMLFLDDTYEIDMLIRMLEEFKRVNYAHFGEWRFI